MEVRRISAEDTYRIRHLMLRPNGTLQDCQFKGDNDELTFHLGAFIESEGHKHLVSVASFYFERHPELPGPYHFRLRGMATLPEHQKKGLSQALLETALPVIKQNQCTILWCNARLSAQGFYEKVGFKKVGDVFEIPQVGPHVMMFISV